MLKVLLVDDEPYVIEGLKMVIDWGGLGYIICGTASNGEDALEIIKQVNPHIVITDINMPVINGLQLIKYTMEELHLRTKFLILSGYNEFKFAQEAMKYNVQGYVLKPIQKEELTRALIKLHKQFEAEKSSDLVRERELKFIANNLLNRIISGEKRDSLFRRAKFILKLSDLEKIRYAMLEIGVCADWMDELDEKEMHSRRNLIRSLIENEIGKEYFLNVFEDGIDRYGIVLPENEFCNLELKRIIDRINTAFGRDIEVRIALSVSEPGNGIEMLEEMYRQAKLAMGYRFFVGFGKIIFFKEIKDVSINYNISHINTNTLINMIKSHETEKIDKCIDKIFFEFSMSKKAPEVVNAYIQNIEMEIFNEILELSEVPDSGVELMEGFNNIIEKVTMQEVKKNFAYLCREASEILLILRNQKSKDIIFEVKEYIKNNFSKELKLRSVAKQFFINPVYLGQLFKKSTGMQFNEYVHSRKIEEAKKLLRRTDMKIADIANMVGYCDADYFATKFKQFTQTVPSEYKKGK